MSGKYLKKVKLSMENCNLGIRPFIPQSSKDTVEPIKSIIGDDIDVCEVFGVIFLNQRNKSIGWYKVSSGGISTCLVDVRILMASALNCLATGMILFHNHPSGSLIPSNADMEITAKIKNACGIMNIQLFDHIIISEEGYYSFSDEGKL